MKKISTDQLKALQNDIYRLNPPVQVWEAMVKFFDSLPDADENK
jgi:hypothetical protein